MVDADADAGSGSVEMSIEMSADLSSEISIEEIPVDPRGAQTSMEIPALSPSQSASALTPIGIGGSARDGDHHDADGPNSRRSAAASEPFAAPPLAVALPQSAITSPIHGSAGRRPPAIASLEETAPPAEIAAPKVDQVAPSAESPPPSAQLEQLLGEGEHAAVEKRRHGGTSALDEIVQILGRELFGDAAAGLDAPFTRELAVQLALLLWDGYGRADLSTQILDGSTGRGAVEHSVATALRLQAAIDSPQPSEALTTLAQRLRTRVGAGPAQSGRAEVGELLLFRGAHAAAAELLAEACADAEAEGDRDARASLGRLRALALALTDRRHEAAALLESDPQADRSDLLWAAHLYEQATPLDGTKPYEGALERVLSRACAVETAVAQDAGTNPVALLMAIERLYGLKLRAHQRDELSPLLRRKLDLLGGLPALTESQPELVVANPRALRRVELLVTALKLAGLLSEAGSAEADLEAATLLDAVAGFAARHKEAAAPLGRVLALVECARLCERRGEWGAAAERFEALGLLLIDLGGLGSPSETPASAADLATRLDSLAQAAALSYLQRAAELITPASPAGRGEGGEATTHALVLYGRLAELSASDEVLALRRLSLLLPLGREAATEVVASLAALAELAPPARSLRFAAWAARASEALRVPGADLQNTHLLRGLDGSARQRLRDLEALGRQARRRGDHPQLVQIYSLIGSLLGSLKSGGASGAASDAVATAAAVYQSVAVVLQAGLSEDTHDHAMLLSLQEAAESKPGRSSGVLTGATRVLLGQQIGVRAGDLGQALTTLLGRVRSRETQIQLYRQLGHHAAEHAGDVTLAENSFHQVLARHPDDVMALHALARLVEQRGETTQALTLLQQAVEAALRMPAGSDKAQDEPPSGAMTGLPALDALLAKEKQSDKRRRQPGREVGAQAAALLCCELGALYEQLAHTAQEPTAAIDQAVACYSEALRRDPRCRPAARALVVLYRAMQRPTEMLAAMELLLPLLRDDQQRLGLLIEMGEAAMQRALSTESSPGVVPSAAAMPVFELGLRAYSEALTLEPDHAIAISNLTLLCQRTGRFALLADSLKRSPRTLQVLAALREAYESLGAPRELAAIYEQQLEQQLVQAAEQAPGARAASIATARALAMLYQRLEQPDEEARTWERLYDLSPEELWNEVPVLLMLERRYGQGGRHAEQAALLSRALEHLGAEQTRRPSDTELTGRRRALLLRLGDVQRDFLNAPAQATATFEQVLTEWPEEHAALRALIDLYGNQGREGEQLRVLTTLLEVTVETSERSRLLFQLGELDEKKGNIEEAYGRYGQAFYLDPSNRGAFTAYERLCYRREQWPEALRIYDAALKLIETQKTRSYRPADLHVRRGQVLLQYLQKTDEALSHYLRAMETDAENDTTQTTIERIYAGRNQWRELLSAYERRAGLVREDMKRVEILRRAARVATAKLRDVAEAVRFYEKLHAVDPTDSEALDALEHHYDRSQDFEKLHGLLSTRVALSVDEQQIIALNMRIGLLSEEGLRDHDRAISAYRHVVEQQPTHREALDAMARLFEANERWAELIDVTRRQIRLVTDRAQKALLYFKCGSVTEAKFGKEDDAIRYYEAAVRTSAACLPALHSLRDIYIRREDWARVTQTLELESKLWTEDKERAGILAHIGQIYHDKLGADAKALEFFEQALSVDKDCLPANRSLFQIHFQRGDWERALGASQVLLQKASREGEPSERSEFHRKRALVALHLGHLRMACDSVNTALEIYPENMQVLELLGTLGRRRNLGVDFTPLCRELEKQFRRRELTRCLARVLCAQAAIIEGSADIEQSEALLKEAVRISPGDHLPTEALAVVYERQRRFRDARARMEAFIEHLDRQTGGDRRAIGEQRARMQLRLAEMCSSAIMDAEQAVAVLRPLSTDSGEFVPVPLRREARFRLAQELYVLGRYAEARIEIEGLVDDPSTPAAAAEESARYHDYLGRILEAQGEDAAAQRAYRRAVDLDPSFAQPVLALARRAARGGERAQAELLMRDALDQLARRVRSTALSTTTIDDRSQARLDEELRLRRGIARLLATFDPKQAAEAYERIIELTTSSLGPDALQTPSWLDDSTEALPAWETLDDRVALADLLQNRLGNVNAARQELHRILRRDLRHAPAYPPLMELYSKNGQADRAERVRALLSLLGYAGPSLSGPSVDRRNSARMFAYRNPLTDELRWRYLFPQLLSGSPYFEFLQLTLDGLLRLFPPPWPLPVETQPANRVWDAGFKVALADAQRLFGLEVEVLFAAQVPGYVLALEPLQAGGRPVVVMEQSVLERSDVERRFLLGRAIEPLRAGYALLLRLSSTEATQFLRLCRGILGTPEERAAAMSGGDAITGSGEGSGDSGLVREFVAQLTRPAQQALERLAERSPLTADSLSPESFLGALPVFADRAGLLLSDDISAAVRVMARAQGEELAVVEGHGGGILLGQVSGGAELARYYLSDSYHDLVGSLRDTSRL